MARTAQYGAADRYSPKQLVQMEDIYPIPDGLFNISQNYSWDYGFYLSSADHPCANPSITTVPDMKINPPLPHRDSNSKATNEPGDGINVDENPTSLPVDKGDKFLAKWQNEG
ncbi:hypothetical protein N7451_012916 [Penicillium sp. IBT 35674x]|nr:hypothetical protein N7451_012916 [Penicillium sp. IBT 35674x]